MKRWLDSKPPSDAQIAAAKAAGYGGWALYHGVPGDGIAPDHLASDDDFRRVLAGGLQTLAYVSGNDSPLAVRTWSQATGILTVVDVERFIREDGPWLDTWLLLSGSGLYGNGSVHFEVGQPPGRGAACNIFAGYYGYDPQTTWPSWLSQPQVCGWQFLGSHAEFGMSVDSMWADDNLGGDDLSAEDTANIKKILQYLDGSHLATPVDPSHPSLDARVEEIYKEQRGEFQFDVHSLVTGAKVDPAFTASLPEILKAIKAIQSASGGLTQQQVTDAVTAALKTLTLKAT